MNLNLNNFHKHGLRIPNAALTSWSWSQPFVLWWEHFVLDPNLVQIFALLQLAWQTLYNWKLHALSPITMHHPKWIVILHRFLTISHGVSYEETHMVITYYWKSTQILILVKSWTLENFQLLNAALLSKHNA